VGDKGENMYSSAIIPLILLAGVFSVLAQGFEEDVYPTEQGDLKITFIGHGSLMFTFNGMIIQVDPVTRYADYSKMVKADLILVTHDHGDHFDKAVIQTLTKGDTALILTEKCLAETGIQGAIVMKNGDVRSVKGIKIEAVPAYNLEHMRSQGVPYHLKGEGNGYVLTFGDKRVYVAGDTENTPEMKALKEIDIAFLPMNLPYTMTPEMVTDAAKAFRPETLYPYHFGGTEPTKVLELLKDSPVTKVLVRKMQ
jgi:L-ascorbate metabolism protein UlaG (beta-lactamase superfamily)